jgi:hypothetical protein
MRKQFRVGSRLSWIVAWLLALIAPAMYLLWSSTATGWIATLLLVPIVGLAAWRADQKGYDSYYGPGDGGLWGPPSS